MDSILSQVISAVAQASAALRGLALALVLSIIGLLLRQELGPVGAVPVDGDRL